MNSLGSGEEGMDSLTVIHGEWQRVGSRAKIFVILYNVISITLIFTKKRARGFIYGTTDA